MKPPIQPILPRHLEHIFVIEQAAHSHPWSKAQLSQLQGKGACHQVLLHQDKVIGYYYAQLIAGEMSLLNIAVSPDEQNKGHGKGLLTHLIHQATQNSAESIWLEVRASNNRALALYDFLGFHQVDKRKDYYPASKANSTDREDAIIMSYVV